MYLRHRWKFNSNLVVRTAWTAVCMCVCVLDLLPRGLLAFLWPCDYSASAATAIRRGCRAIFLVTTAVQSFATNRLGLAAEGRRGRADLRERVLPEPSREHQFRGSNLDGSSLPLGATRNLVVVAVDALRGE